jgi:hypothetical protein
MEPRHQVCLRHVPKVFREPITGFHDLLRQKRLSVDNVRVEFNLNGLPASAVHISAFCGKDVRIVVMNAASVVTAFSYGQLVGIL